MNQNNFFSFFKNNSQSRFFNTLNSGLLVLMVLLISNTKLAAQCTSNATSTADEDILNVTFGTLNNTTSCSSTGGTGSILNEYSNFAYAGFPGGIPNVDRGCAIPFSVQIGTCGGNYNNCVAIYIDWNNDLDFLDPGEQVYNSTASTVGPHTETGIITIPVTATLGNCRMRVINVETATPSNINSCGTYSWGETEDYLVNVTNSGGVAPYISSTVNQIVGGSVSQCAYFQQIICIPVVMGAGCTAGALTQFQLGAGSSTNFLGDVSKIHIFYTGSSNAYSPINEFVVGGSVPAAAANTINGSQTLLPNTTNYFWVTYDMNNASTVGDLIDGSCTQITIAGTNQVPSITDPAGSGTIVVCPCSFSLGSDVSLCAPINYTINGPVGYDSYTWTPGGATTQNLSVTAAGNYTCTATIINGGLVLNGDFNAGNTDFTSNYVIGTGGTYGQLSNPGTYAVTTSPNLVHNNFYAFGDHTTGTGSMLVCNGSSIANDVAWSQTITITPNTFYNFSAWVASVENTTSGSEALLQFSINGALIGPVVNAPLTGGTWLNFFVNWNSGSATSAVIKIVDQNLSGGANDFALDDINFERVCTYSDVIAVNIGSSTTVSVPSNITVCNTASVAASSFTSNPAGATFSWSSSNPAIGLAASGSSNTPVFNAINTGTGVVTSIVTVTPSVGGCPGTPSSYTITVNPDPVITVNNPVTCSGIPTILTANGASNYTWSTGATTQTVSVAPTGNTVYTVTGTTNGCIGTATSTVSVNSSLSISVNDATICAGTNTVLTAGGATSYTWSTGATTSSISVSPGSTTVYTVNGEAAGCSGTNTITVTVNSLPVISVTGQGICAGATATLSANGATSYSWSTGATTQSISVSPLSTTIYSVSGTVNGCSATDTAEVIINAIPTLTVNSPATCAGVPVTLTANGATSYSWSTGATTQTISVVPLVNTVYTVTGTTNGCAGSTTSTVSINASLSISVSNATICAGSTTVLTAGGGATSYTWSTGATTSTINVSPGSTTVYTVSGEASGCTGNTNATVTVNASPVITVASYTLCAGTSTILTANTAAGYLWNTGATTQTISVSPIATTVYTVTGTTNNCSASTTATVTVNALPIVTVNSPAVCSGASATLTALGAGTYSWIPATGLSSTTGSTVIANPGSSVIYTVTGTLNGCMASNTSTVSISTLPTLAVNNPTICSGQTAAVTVTASLPGGTYIWSPGNQTSQGISVSPASTTSYSVVYTVNSCSAAVAATVLVNATPTVSIASATICEGQTATLTAVPSISGGTYAWAPSGQTSQSISDAPASASVYGVLYALNGCTATATGSISVEVNPVLTLSPSSATTTPFEGVLITATGGGNYNWNTGETSSVISVSPQNSTTYCATVTTIAGCKNTACIEIIVMDESTLYIPNVFTPNGDGVNDVFYTPNRNIVSYSLTIFNRWGQLLFNADDASKGWDGTYKGKVVPDGVYVFMLQAKGADDVIYKQSGHITVFQ